ncbi:phytanoyl-CoA dioxygenase family protein [uncultured Roseibium sp.]|uniref:phytanoyl-CoA dioxygenase family protein n=1 Tax=uncultured Roseibium sp. TaxID=1936171 RepID=UPI0032171495
MEPNGIRAEFQRHGRLWFRGKLKSQELAVLDEAANLDLKAGERVEPRPEIVDILSRDSGLAHIMSLFGKSLVPVRIVGFNKTQKNNWSVPWHQDRIISVAERHDLSGFGNWSRKSGIWHCEPPEAILNQMFFVRVHLDDTSADDGAMRIAVGSHKEGVIPADAARSISETYPLEECQARRGDVLVLKMLTLHASQPSRSENKRRVFRVDYAPIDLLPAPLVWHGLCSESD